MAEPLKAKKPKRVCHFYREWTKEFLGIGTNSKGKLVASLFSIIESQFNLLLSHFYHISVLIILILSAINILIKYGPGLWVWLRLISGFYFLSLSPQTKSWQV